MPLLTVEIDAPERPMATRHSELAFAVRALELAAKAVQGPGGTALTGEIMGDGAVVLGRFKYEPQARSWEGEAMTNHEASREIPLYRATRTVTPSPNPRHRTEAPFSTQSNPDCWQFGDRVIEAGEVIASTDWPHPSFRPLNESARRVMTYFASAMRSRLPRSPWRDGRIHLDDGLTSAAVTNVPGPNLPRSMGGTAA
jgi:hypothetical protein